MDRRDFLRKLVSPHAPEGKVYPVEVQSIPYLSKALGKEPEELKYVDADDVTTYNYTYHLERTRAGQRVGILVLSLQLVDDCSGGEVTISDLKVRQSPRRESLSNATHFSISDERITFYEGDVQLSISYNYEVKVRYLRSD